MKLLFDIWVNYTSSFIGEHGVGMVAFLVFALPFCVFPCLFNQRATFFQLLFYLLNVSTQFMYGLYLSFLLVKRDWIDCLIDWI